MTVRRILRVYIFSNCKIHAPSDRVMSFPLSWASVQ